MPNNNSLETILTYESGDVDSTWSVVWSTAHVPGMDNARGHRRGGRHHVTVGRRRLRFASLGLASMLTMHCPVAASAATAGFIVFTLLLVAMVGILANPLRHFEVYVGQWSISGPGRAFRMVPMLDGIGLSICINAIIRAICCCCIAGVTALYVLDSVSDAKVPFSTCRDLNLKTYDPVIKEVALKPTAFLRRRYHLSREKSKTSSGMKRYAKKMASGNARRSDDTHNISHKPEKFSIKDSPAVHAQMYSDKDIPVHYAYKYTAKYMPISNVHKKYVKPADSALKTYAADVTPAQYIPTLTNSEISSNYSDTAKAQEASNLTSDDLAGNTKLKKPFFTRLNRSRRAMAKRMVYMCNEHYNDQKYPPLHTAPAYNYFYLDVMHYREAPFFEYFNVRLAISTTVVWVVLWAFMVYEKISFGRLMWNNMSPWVMVVPVLWETVVIATAVAHLITVPGLLQRNFRITTKEILVGIAHALEISMLTHSASTGTELIHGKGLNHYAVGHIDPRLNGENLMHSAYIILLSTIHLGGAAACTLVDYTQPKYNYTANEIRESSLWILPMYSKCTLSGNYSHISSTMIFSGLTVSYMIVAYNFLKTALHTIFEYRVKLVFIEQVIVAALIMPCMLLSLLVSTNGGLPLLESVDTMMVGLAAPIVCLLEMTALLYLYRSHDFMSDLDAATQDNECGSRVGYQWQILPFILGATIVVKIVVLPSAIIPSQFLTIAVIPLLAVVLATPIRAAVNAYKFTRPRRRGA